MVSRRNDEWLTRERLLVLVLAGATVLVAWLCWHLVKPFVPSITWALVLAVLAHPMHERIAAKLKRPSVSTALAVVLVTIVIALPATLVVRQIAIEAVEIASGVRKLVDADRWKLAIERFPRLAPLREWVEREVDVEDKVGEASTEVAKSVRGLLQRPVDLAIAVLITLFLLFYFLRVIGQFVPLAPSETEHVRNDIRDTIAAVVFGTLAVAVVQGTLGGLMFWWLDLPAPILWGAIMAVLAILPLFGAALIWVPAAVYLAIDGQ